MSRGLQRMRAERRRLSTLDRALARSRIWPAPHFFPEGSRGLDKRRTRYYPSPAEKSKSLRKGRRRESRRRMMSHFNGKSPVHRLPSCFILHRDCLRSARRTFCICVTFSLQFDRGGSSQARLSLTGCTPRRRRPAPGASPPASRWFLPLHRPPPPPRGESS